MTARQRKTSEPVAILVAEDNKYDRMFLQQAFDELGHDVRLHFVGNGEDVLDYLLRRNAYASAEAAPRPALVLMDLNMPLMNGNEALKAIRASEELRMLPVIVLSTSDNPRQVAQAYANGVNAFMTKPGPYEEFLDLISKFSAYWLAGARLPKIGAWQNEARAD